MKGGDSLITAKWREGFGFYKDVDPNEVAKEIRTIGEEATPQQIVDLARNERTELHKCFEWDDSIAAEKYRLQQARNVIHFLVIREEEVPKDRPEIRFFYKTDNNEGYKSTTFIIRHDDEYKNLLAKAWAELKAFKKKYACLKDDLGDIFDMIN